jgi:hypothetical protein
MNLSVASKGAERIQDIVPVRSAFLDPLFFRMMGKADGTSPKQSSEKQIAARQDCAPALVEQDMPLETREITDLPAFFVNLIVPAH